MSLQNRDLNFVEFNKRNRDDNSVWNYFMREEKGQLAQCKFEDCKKILKSGGGTTSLHNHLKTHQIVVVKEKSKDESSNKIKKIDNYFKKDEDSLKLRLSRMTSLDGIPFSVFITSKDMRDMIKSMGFKEKLPNSSTSIRQIVMEYSKNVREMQIKEIQKIKIDGSKFSVIFDEWSSKKNRRYLNIILKSESSQFWNIGLIRIKESFTWDIGLKMVQEKLKSYDLCLQKDIIAIVTDGCAVNIKIAKEADIFQQLCLAHMLQLCISDVLYPKKRKKIDDIVSSTIIESVSEYEFDSDNDEFMVYIESIEDEIIHQDYGPIISKVRKIINLFKRSSVKNDILQKYVVSDFNKEISLDIDCKTRWSSLLMMLEKFLKLKNCIKKALIDIESRESLEDSDFSHIKDVVESLQPFKLAVDALCRRDSTLLSADIVLGFCLKTINNQKSNIGSDLYESLKIRISQRRTQLSSLMQYLHTGKMYLYLKMKFLQHYQRLLLQIPSKNLY